MIGRGAGILLYSISGWLAEMNGSWRRKFLESGGESTFHAISSSNSLYSVIQAQAAAAAIAKFIEAATIEE